MYISLQMGKSILMIKLVKKYNLEFEAFDFSFINLRNGQGRLIIEKRNGDVITHEFEL